MFIGDSFYTCRCFGTYTREGMDMLAEGIKPAIIENVGRQAGMPMGALEVSDSVGLDTALKVTRAMAEATGIDLQSDDRTQFLAWLVEDQGLSLIPILRCRRIEKCQSRATPYSLKIKV